MKIKKLNIGSYRHLENINLDFTYPEGHAKAGMPLDKICFIGQSATGKTSILELLKQSAFVLSGAEPLNGKGLLRHEGLKFDGEVEFLYEDIQLAVNRNGAHVDGNQYFKFLQKRGPAWSAPELKLLYFSAEIISDKIIRIFNQNPLNILNALSEGGQSYYHKRNDDSNYIYEFTQEVDEQIWFSLLSKILDYRKNFTQMAAELINKGSIGDLEKLNKEFNRWSEQNKNPLIPFAELFNPIIEKLNLEIDLVNTEYSIPIKSKVKNEIVPISGLSTGTKGLLLSFFPLYEFNTDDAIILIDEPERSLFPDLQVDLMSYYQRLAPNAQLITATHSPFIAAAFEPEERFILYFDDNGKISVRRGEAPIGDDPNDILRNDFQVDFYNDYGKKAYKQYLDLKRRMQEETEPQKKKELLSELTQLGDKYNF
ncbi:AAA family ATPase [Chitinophaga filiformis]|uniref:ATP-binding protein n=1 Tax=Chitinophaga filiformis TaxID=104663 RepID=UPI001F433ED7|nr:ATP-binding protein [Chitinophaga filiformis]MCF6401738.1 AAA family ATPase [Chitinophaga filiformis]